MGPTLLALLILAPAVPAAPSAAEPPDSKLWDECANADPDGYGRSIAACTALIESGRLDGRNLGTAYYNRGTARSRDGDEARAIADFGEAIRLDPNDVSAFVNRGIAYLNKGDHRLAIADLDEAIRLDPKQESAWSARGDVYSALGDHARAIADYGEVIRLNPRDSDAYYNRGLSWRQHGDDDKALADYDESIRLAPQASDAHNNRGYIYFRRGDLKRAIADYKRAVGLQPDNIEAQANLCWSMTLEGKDLDRARAACDSVLAMKDHPETRVRRGIIGYRQGRFRQAWSDFDAALRLDPESGLARYGRGLAAGKLDRKADSEADIAAAKSKRPGVAAEYENYGIPR